MEFRLKIFLAFGGREWKSRKENGHDHTRENYIEAMIGIKYSIPLATSKWSYFLFSAGSRCVTLHVGSEILGRVPVSARYVA